MPAFFSKDDFQKFIPVVGNHHLRDVFLFAVMTGLRRGEILNLRWTDVSLNLKLLQVESSVSFHVKAGKRRTIPLSEQAIQLLQKQGVTAKSEYVFEHRGWRIKGIYVTHKFKHFVRVAGLDEGLHFYSCRHTAATWLVQNRVSLHEVQKLLGHSDISTTQIYSHFVSSELHDAANKISVPL